MSLRLLHILPSFSPARDGIADFTLNLASELHKHSGIENSFLALEADCAPEALLLLANRTGPHLAATLAEADCEQILLHYSGYGFHPRGTPAWLADGLAAHLHSSGIRLHTYFHELWSSGAPWTSQFYLQVRQRRLIRRLHELSQTAFTSTPKMQRMLRGPGPCARVLPVPSPIPARRTIADELPAATFGAIIFGQEHTRARALRAHASFLAQAIESNQMGKLLLAGRNASVEEIAAHPRLAALKRKIVVLANPSPEQLRSLFSQAEVLLSFYPSHLITKSSTAMAAMAGGCPVLLPRRDSGSHYLPEPPLMYCDGSPRQVKALLEGRARGLWRDTAKAASSWYQKNATPQALAAAIAAALHSGQAAGLAEAPR